MIISIPTDYYPSTACLLPVHTLQWYSTEQLRKPHKCSMRRRGLHPWWLQQLHGTWINRECQRIFVLMPFAFWMGWYGWQQRQGNLTSQFRPNCRESWECIFFIGNTFITFWSDPFFNEFEIWHDKFSNISMHRMEQWVSCFFFNSIIRFHCKQGLAPLLTFTLPSNHFFPLVWLISGPPDGPGRNPNPVFNAWASDLNESCLNHPWIDNFDKRFQIRTHYDEVY